MGPCRRCNRSGRCRNCTCHKEARGCSNCMPGRNGRCENRRTVAASTRMEDRQNGGSLAARESIPKHGSTTANEIMTGTEGESEEGETQGKQTDNEDSCDSQSGACDRAMVRDFPQFAKMASPTYKCGEVDGETFAHSVECCYEEIVHWRRFLFKIPSGKAGKSFVHELTKLFRTYADGSTKSSNGAACTNAAKAKDYSNHLDRRLRMWASGDINTLMLECRTIQGQLTTRARNNETASKARTFAKLMMEGKVRAALRTITTTANGGVLSLTKEVREALIKKHLPKQQMVPVVPLA